MDWTTNIAELEIYVLNISAQLKVKIKLSLFIYFISISIHHLAKLLFTGDYNITWLEGAGTTLPQLLGKLVVAGLS